MCIWRSTPELKQLHFLVNHALADLLKEYAPEHHGGRSAVTGRKFDDELRLFGFRHGCV